MFLGMCLQFFSDQEALKKTKEFNSALNDFLEDSASSSSDQDTINTQTFEQEYDYLLRHGKKRQFDVNQLQKSKQRKTKTAQIWRPIVEEIDMETFDGLKNAVKVFIGEFLRFVPFLLVSLTTEPTSSATRVLLCTSFSITITLNACQKHFLLCHAQLYKLLLFIPNIILARQPTTHRNTFIQTLTILPLRTDYTWNAVE